MRHDSQHKAGLRGIAGPAVAALLSLLFTVTQAAAQQPDTLNGVALVIGQSKYEYITPLPNPANDAREMVKMLTDLGFDARVVSDRDSDRLKRDLERFVEDAEEADVALLYYSGHAIEAGGENWLIPVDGDVTSLANASEALVPLSKVMDEIKAKVPVSIVLLDACRTNPFPPDALVRVKPSASAEPIGAGGLVPVRGAVALKSGAPAAKDNLGTVIGFAAEPGRPALDGAAGETSPYASALLRHLTAMKGAEFGAVMRMVTEEVYLDTGGEQRPWVNESLRRLLYFGMSPEEPSGAEGLITGERRQLLLTISELPDPNRAQVELAAAKDGVPLGALYGVLKALGTENIPEDPSELEKVLDAQAQRLKKMMADRDALRADDPEIVRLVASADQAIGEGAIAAARSFLDDAVKRVEETAAVVDAAEEAVRRKRLADAAVYVQRADAAALAFDFIAAADDYAKAFDLVEKWDDRLRWNYKNMEAEALNAHGGATGDRASLDRAIAAYEQILRFIEPGDDVRDGAITRNNMAVVMQTIGERAEDSDYLERAAAIFRDSLTVFEAEQDDINWAAAQNNLGNILLELGERGGDRALLEQAIAAFRATLEKRGRAAVPLDWASSQNNLGIALYVLSQLETGRERLVESESAYRSALEEYTRGKAPVQWAMVQNNLGNTLNALGNFSTDGAEYRAAAQAYRAALEVRTKETFPLSWAASKLNLGSALNNITRYDLDTGLLEEAVASYEDALTVYSRDRFPLDWAATQNNIGSVYQTLGQRNMSAGQLEQSASAFRAARRVYDRRKFPLDWAMVQFNLGNTLQLLGGLSGQPVRYKEAIEAYENALKEYSRESTPRQWAMAQAHLGAAYHWMSNSETQTTSLTASIAARRAALEVLTAENAPADWATAQDGMGMSFIMLGNREQTAKYLPEAKAAFEAALTIYRRETHPLQWAFGQNNLGDVHWNLATFGGGGKPEFAKALVYFENARQGFSEAGLLSPIAITDQKIELVKQALAAN